MPGREALPGGFARRCDFCLRFRGFVVDYDFMEQGTAAISGLLQCRLVSRAGAGVGSSAQWMAYGV